MSPAGLIAALKQFDSTTSMRLPFGTVPSGRDLVASGGVKGFEIARTRSALGGGRLVAVVGRVEVAVVLGRPRLVDAAVLSEGLNTVRVCVSDAAGNVGSAETVVTKDSSPFLRV